MKFQLFCLTFFLSVNLSFASKPFFNKSLFNGGITTGTYGLGAKISVLTNYGFEFRYNFGTDIRIYIGRVSYSHLYLKSQFIPYIGLDWGYIDFNYDRITGNGMLWDIFIGSEFRLTKNLTFSGDIGYANVTVQTSEFTVNGPEYVYNLGINWYVFR